MTARTLLRAAGVLLAGLALGSLPFLRYGLPHRHDHAHHAHAGADAGRAHTHAPHARGGSHAP